MHLFVAHFAANKAKPPITTDLFEVKQSRGEWIKQYLRCFNEVVVQCSSQFKVGRHLDELLVISLQAPSGNEGAPLVMTLRHSSQ